MSDMTMYEAMREFIRAQVALEVAKASFSAIPSPRSASVVEVRSGPSGRDGRDGKDGVDGKEAIGIADVLTRNGDLVIRLTDSTERNLGRIEPRDGKDGERGEAGPAGDSIVGPPGPVGEKGERGADGAPSTVPGPKGDTGERGADSVIPGPKGETGERGADGIATLEEIEAIVERSVTALHTRSLADYLRGTFAPGTEYTRGSVVVWDGTSWLATNDTNGTPGNSPDWKLLAKKGRDGRDRK